MSRGRTDWVQVLGKWRVLLAGWQLGTRAKGDPECDAVRDHREQSLMLRCEVSALASLLVSKGVITKNEYAEAVQSEAKYYNECLELRFPGVRATEEGLTFDARAAETMKGWKP